MSFFSKNKSFFIGLSAGALLQAIVFCILRLRINYSYYLYIAMFCGMSACILLDKYEKRFLYPIFPVMLFLAVFVKNDIFIIKTLTTVLLSFGAGASIYICSEYIFPEKEDKSKNFFGGMLGFVLGMLLYII